MKKQKFATIVALALLCFFFSKTKAQVLEILADPDLNYYETVEKVEAAIDQMPKTRSSEQVGEIKRFQRWKYFWNTRVDEQGNFDRYVQELNAYYNKRTPSSNKSLPKWNSLGPTHEGQYLATKGEIGVVNNVWGIASGEMIIATHGGGLWKRHNLASDWQPIAEDMVWGGIFGMAVNPRNTDEIYLGRGIHFSGQTKRYGSYSSAFMYSYDGGHTFNEANVNNCPTPMLPEVKEIKINPHDDERLLLMSSHQIYASNSKGQGWDLVYHDTSKLLSLENLVYDPKNPDIVFASGDNVLIKSTTGGRGWSANLYQHFLNYNNLEDTCKITIDIDNNGIIYAYYYKKKKKSVHCIFNASTSWNGSGAWNKFNEINYGRAAPYCAIIKVSPEGNIFYGGVKVHKYDMNTGMVTQLDSVHSDIRDIYFPNGDESMVYIAHDGGVSISTNPEATNYTQINDNITLSELYDVAIHPTIPNYYVIGAHDNHSFVYRNGLWDNVGAGDGGICHINVDNPNIIFTLENGWVTRSDDYGLTNDSVYGLHKGEYNRHYIANPLNSAVMYSTYWKKDPNWTSGRQCIVQSTNGGVRFDTINPITNFWGRDVIFGLSKADTNYIYYAYALWEPGEEPINIRLTKDRGITSSSISEDVIDDCPLGRVTSFYVCETNANHVYISIANFEKEKVFYSANAGQEWTDFSEGLPNLPTHKIIVDETNGTAYLATDVGVFYREQKMDKWELFNNGLPKVMVTDIELNKYTRELIISTYGRGIWKASLECSNESVLTIKGDQTWNDNTQVCGGISLYHGSSLALNADLCVPSDKGIVVRSPSNLYLNENSAVLNTDGTAFKGNIDIQHSSVLEMSNSTINLGIGGVITIGVGATLKGKGTIVLNNGTKIKLDGEIKPESGSALIILGNGRVVMSGTLTALTSTNFSIDGTAQSNVILELGNRAEFGSNFTNIDISDGCIQMNNTDAELYIHSGVDNVTIDNVKVFSYMTSYNGHEGLDIRSSGNVTVTNSIFEGGRYGLYTYRGRTTPNLEIDNCIFRKCDYGLYVYNGGVNVSNSIAENNNNKGISCNSMDKASSFFNNTINDNVGEGIYYSGSPASNVSFTKNTVQNNFFGVYANGTFLSEFYCNTIVNNTNSGIKIYNGDVYLAYTTGVVAGRNILSGQSYGVYLSGSYSSFYINNGNNTLKDNNYCMYGTPKGMVGGTVEAHNNYWKTSGGAPISGTDYSLSGSNGSIYLRDYSPNHAISDCFVVAPGKGKSLEKNISTSYAPYEESFEYREVSTALGDMPMHEAINRIVNTDSTLAEVYDAETRYELLTSLLQNNLKELNLGEKWYVQYAYQACKSAFGKIEYNEENSDSYIKNIFKMLKVIRKLDKDEQAEEKSDNKWAELSGRRYMFVLDLANNLSYNNQHDFAIMLLNLATYKVNDSLVCELEQLACEIKADKIMQENNDTLDIEDLLAECVPCEESQKSAEFGSESSEDAQNSKALSSPVFQTNEYSIDIMPHPVSSNAEIKIQAIAGAEVTIYNSLGQIVLTEKLENEQYIKSISSQNYEKGLYIISLSLNGELLQSKEMVIIE